MDDAFASNCGPGIGTESHGTQQVRAPAGPVGRRGVEGLVGDDPPFHTPVFILTHHPRATIEMTGGLLAIIESRVL